MQIKFLAQENNKRFGTLTHITWAKSALTLDLCFFVHTTANTTMTNNVNNITVMIENATSNNVSKLLSSLPVNKRL